MWAVRGLGVSGAVKGSERARDMRFWEDQVQSTSENHMGSMLNMASDWHGVPFGPAVRAPARLLRVLEPPAAAGVLPAAWRGLESCGARGA